DEPSVHFAGPLVYAPHAARTRHVFERQVLGHAHAAKQLHRAVGDAHDHFTALQLAHARVAPPVRIPLVDHAREPPRDEAHHFHFLEAVGDPPLHRLTVVA